MVAWLLSNPPSPGGAWLLSHPPQDRSGTGPRLAEQFPSWVVAVCSRGGGEQTLFGLFGKEWHSPLVVSAMGMGAWGKQQPSCQLFANLEIQHQQKMPPILASFSGSGQHCLGQTWAVGQVPSRVRGCISKYTLSPTGTSRASV